MKLSQRGDRREVGGLAETGRRQDAIGRVAAIILDRRRVAAGQHEHIETRKHREAAVAQVRCVGRGREDAGTRRVDGEPI